MRQSKYVHTPHDGRGRRDVFLNGKCITRVLYADTKRGVVRVTHDPIKLDKRRKKIRTQTLRGTVDVVFRQDTTQDAHSEPRLNDQA